MLIIGIDPGISGSICFLDNGKILDVIEMPIMTDGKKNKKQVNGSQVYNEITKRIKQFEKNQIRVVIEHVSAMPGQGVTSMFNFGQSFGILKGICTAMQLPMYFVRPAKWKKYFNLLNSEKMLAEQEQLKYFLIFQHNSQKKKTLTKLMPFLLLVFTMKLTKKTINPRLMKSNS